MSLLDQIRKTGCFKQPVFKAMRKLFCLCPYTHIWRALQQSRKEGRLPETARTGAFIALLGLFCPIFWIAFFSGASKEELTFHAIHSAIVFCAGVVLFIIGLAKSRPTKDGNKRGT
ncbi:hypothetical protein [Thalassospira sp.]|uniref:hypothetical protein n=1 Tax=Thalassospira sp. TaxID=1912094 RepID=UPI003AA89EC1